MRATWESYIILLVRHSVSPYVIYFYLQQSLYSTKLCHMALRYFQQQEQPLWASITSVIDGVLVFPLNIANVSDLLILSGNKLNVRGSR